MSRSALLLLCSCLTAGMLVVEPVQAKTIRLQDPTPLKQPRTLMGQSRTKIMGAYFKQTHWRWTIPGKPPGGVTKRTRQVGRVSVVRRYTPQKDNTTRVDQFVLEAPRKEKPPTPKLFTSKEAVAFHGMVSLVEELHVKPIERKQIWRAAMRGIADHLDKHTTYFSPKEFKRYVSEGTGKLVGIGAFFKTDGELRVERARRGAPAQRAGVRKGDLLQAVDGKKVSSFSEAAELLQGKPGTSVTLTLSRAGKKLTIPVTRASVEINPVRARITKDGIGYVRLAAFDEGAARKVRRAVKVLKKRGGGGLKGLVLDLRNNPGGQLPEAVALINDFVAPGTLVTTRGREGVERIEANPSQVRHCTLPLAVLVNKDTASASELTAGALRDLGRATLFGSKTYGKGTMQEVIPLTDGSGLKLTTAHYHLPGGATPHKVGVLPDVTRETAKQRFRARSGNSRKVTDYVLAEALCHLRSAK